jgi:hypothetical protein
MNVYRHGLTGSSCKGSISHMVSFDLTNERRVYEEQGREDFFALKSIGFGLEVSGCQTKQSNEGRSAMIRAGLP